MKIILIINITFLTVVLLLSACTFRKDVEDLVEDSLADSSLINSIDNKIKKLENYIEDKLPDTDTTLKDSCTQYFETSLGGTRPENINILNCHYWKSAHWTLEHEYYFELEKNQEFLEDLIYYGDSLKEIETLNNYKQGPDWFTPKGKDKYHIWISKREFDDFQVYQDKESGNIFIHGSQF